MAFRVSKSRTFTAPVQVGEEDFTATFRALPDEALKDFDAPGGDMQKAFLRRVVVELEGLVGDDDQPLGMAPHETRDARQHAGAGDEAAVEIAEDPLRPVQKAPRPGDARLERQDRAGKPVTHRSAKPGWRIEVA